MIESVWSVRSFGSESWRIDSHLDCAVSYHGQQHSATSLLTALHRTRLGLHYITHRNLESKTAAQGLTISVQCFAAISNWLDASICSELVRDNKFGMSISYLGYLVGVCLLILGNNDRYLTGVGSCNFHTHPTSGQIGVERVSVFPPRIFTGQRLHSVHTKVSFNGIDNRGNKPVAIVLERRIDGCLQVHHIGEKDQLEKLQAAGFDLAYTI